MANITTDTPPIWLYRECVEQFGVDYDEGTIFAGNGKIHIKHPENLTPDLIAHEETHLDQHTRFHNDGFRRWWRLYLDDPEFRLEQEVEAYRNQYKYTLEHYDRNKRRLILNKMVKDLSGPMYGKMVTPEKAKKLITENI